MRAAEREVQARVRPLVAATVAVLAFATSAPGLAGQEPDCNGRSVMRVMVLDESGMMPIPGATVVLRWTDTDAVRGPMRQEVDLQGGVRICAPGDAGRATLWAELGDISSRQRSVELEPGMSRDVELRLLLESSATGRLIGRVQDARTDRPVAAVAVSLGGRTVAETNRSGQFILSGVPVGIHELSVQRLGYAPLVHPVVVSKGVTTDLELGLVPDPLEMEPLVAMATRSRRLEVKGFYERKYWGERIGGSTFYTAEDIERRRPIRISHMIAEEPSIRLDCSGRRCRLVSTRASLGFGGRPCGVSVYLDGVSVGRDLDEFVKPLEIAGVEIYRGAASLAAEFGGSDSRCGVVAVWTK